MGDQIAVKSEKTKSEIILIQTAKNLFWKYGVRRVSVEEICKEAGISKMTFYRYFKNKKDIASHVIDFVANNSFQKYRSIMDDDMKFEYKVKELIKLKKEDARGISHEFIKDIYQNNKSDLKAQIETFNQKMIAAVMDDFAQAQKNGEIRKDLTLNFIMYQLNDMSTKLLDEDLRKLFNSEEEMIIELTNFFFYGIMP